MGLHLKDQERRSELQSKVASDLAERLKARPIDEGEVKPAFTDNSHETRPAGMILMVLGFVAFIVALAIALRVGGIL